MANDYPRRCPVAAVLLRADNDTSGNPRRCFLILDHRGKVEALEEGYHGSAILHARWPWFDHRACDRFGLEPAYHVSIDVPVSEYRHALRFEENERALENAGDTDGNPHTPLRAAADRRAARAEVLEAVARLAYQPDVHVMSWDPLRARKLRALRRAGALEEEHEHGYRFWRED